MSYKVLHRVRLTSEYLELNGVRMGESQPEENFLTQLYRKFCIDYPKFFKMDVLCKVGFIASEVLLDAEGVERFVPRADRAVLLFNHHSSLHADQSFQQTIADPEDFYPKPSVFVYTLPNIVTGELAIRNRYHGESNFILLPYKSQDVMNQAVEAAFLNSGTASVLTGWVEALSDQNFESELLLIIKE